MYHQPILLFNKEEHNMAKQTVYTRIFLSSDKTRLVLLAEFPNLPFVKLYADVHSSVAPYKISIASDGTEFEQAIEQLFQPSLVVFFANVFNVKPGDIEVAKLPLSALNALPIGSELTNEFIKIFDNNPVRNFNYKPMPKVKKYLDNLSVGDYVKKHFGYEIVDKTFTLPEVLTVNPMNASAWDHPVIKANPDKFRPKVDPDLVAVIQSESQEFEYIMKHLNKVNPISPNKNYLLVGKPAVGKSETVRAIAHILNLPYAEFTITKTTEFADTFGKISATMPNDSSKSWAFFESDLKAVAEAGGIVNLEEATAMLESNQIEGNNVISGLNRYCYVAGHKVMVHEKTIFFGTANAGMGGLSKMQPAFLSRWEEINFEEPSTKSLYKYYYKKYGKSLDQVVIKALVDLTIGIGDVLAKTEQFKREDPFWGPAPRITNRNRSNLIYLLLLYPTFSVSSVVEMFIRNMIHTNYFTSEVIDKVLVDCENVISVYNHTVKEFYFPTPALSSLGIVGRNSGGSQSKKDEYEVEL